MQKFLSFLIIFILSVLPVVNASASVPSCENMMPESLSLSNSQSMHAELMANMDNASTMASMHDCCETQKLVCDHSNTCDCDNSQVNYSAIPTIQIEQSQYLESSKPLYVSTLFLSKFPDSLYRPPIDILI